MPTVAHINDIVFGEADGRPLALDIARPDPLPDAPMPALLWLHGGGWMTGDKTLAPPPFLAERGFFTVSASYRLSGAAIFPAQLHDAKAAVRWLRAHAVECHIDPDRIGAWGYSSGAHLASLLGVAGDRPELEGAVGSPGHSSRVQAVVAMAGPSDFTAMGGWHDAPDSPEARLVGGPLGERAELVRMANPITYARPGAPPFLLIHGDADDTVPINQSELLYRALADAGAEATFVRLAGVGHEFNRRLCERTNPELEALIAAFFTKHLAK